MQNNEPIMCVTHRSFAYHIVDRTCTKAEDVSTKMKLGTSCSPSTLALCEADTGSSCSELSSGKTGRHCNLMRLCSCWEADVAGRVPKQLKRVYLLCATMDKDAEACVAQWATWLRIQSAPSSDALQAAEIGGFVRGCLLVSWQSSCREAGFVPELVTTSLDPGWMLQLISHTYRA